MDSQPLLILDRYVLVSIEPKREARHSIGDTGLPGSHVEPPLNERHIKMEIFF